VVAVAGGQQIDIVISAPRIGPNAWRQQKSGSDLRRPLPEIAGSDPEAVESAEHAVGALEVLRGKPRLQQHLGMALMQRR
jgi:hypothetical protein